jgi:hypothetical protein
MRRLHQLAACLLAAAPLGAASGQADLASKIVNDPGTPQVNGAKGRLVSDPKAQGGKALRVAVARKGTNIWDSVVESPLTKPVKAGDRLVLAFEARLQQSADGSTSAVVPYTAIQMVAAPYTGIASGQVTVGPEWQQHRVEGKADKDYPAGALKASIQIGNAKQQIDFGPIVVLNMGQ